MGFVFKGLIGVYSMQKDPLQDMELQEKGEDQNEKHVGKLIRKNQR